MSTPESTGPDQPKRTWPEASGPRPAEPTSASIALELARDQLAAQLAAADSDDVKALGYLAVDVAGSAALFATRDTLNARWWWPTIGLAAAALLLILALLKERYPSGPEPLEVYFGDSETPILDATFAVTAAREEVRRLRSRPRRAWAYRGSLTLTGISVVGGGIVLFGVR